MQPLAPETEFVDCLTVALFLLVLCTTGRSASTVEYLRLLRTTVSRRLGGGSNVVPIVPTESRLGRTRYPFGVLQRVLINSPSPKKRCMFIKEMATVTHAKPCGTFSLITALSGTGKDMTYHNGH